MTAMGDLVTKMEIVKEVTPPDRNKYGEEVPRYESMGTVWASLPTKTGGSEPKVKGRASPSAMAIASIQIAIRHFQGLHPKHRLWWGDRVFEITYIDDNDAQFSLLHCEEMVKEEKREI